MEDVMARKYIDCREYPSEMNCALALGALSRVARACVRSFR
jgi:hypothetical protein